MTHIPWPHQKSNPCCKDAMFVNWMPIWSTTQGLLQYRIILNISRNLFQISFAHNSFVNCPIVVKFCTEHGSDTAMLWAKFRNYWVTNWCYGWTRFDDIWGYDEFWCDILYCNSLWNSTELWILQSSQTQYPLYLGSVLNIQQPLLKWDQVD